MKASIIINIIILSLLISCSEKIEVSRSIDTLPNITPDYTNITFPANIAPLNFALIDSLIDAAAIEIDNDSEQIYITAKNNKFRIPQKTWKKIITKSTNGKIKVSVFIKRNNEWISYAPFFWNISNELIDPYVVYRLIEPGYETWNNMGIYQRNIENYNEDAIIENKLMEKNCINCHSFCMQNPSKMMLHLRANFPCTIILDEKNIEKLNTKTKQTISPLVYPSWHPSGRFIAFSVNNTAQSFHSIDANRIEVFDYESDVVVYDIEKHEILTTELIFSDKSFETFPTFSPDGKTLYFCTSPKYEMPDEYEKVKYSICSISFDETQRKFGNNVDTLFNATYFNKSASFPRISPNGKFLLFTLSDYGNFSIWHKDADLYMINLLTKEFYPLDKANSDDVDSYHSWSSNSRWIVFSSRRDDGLYTRPHFAYIDDNGQATKAFALPQKDPLFHKRFMKSYNIPEFITDKVKFNGFDISETAKYDEGIDINFRME